MNILKKAEALNQNPSISSIISVLQEMAAELEKLIPVKPEIVEVEKNIEKTEAIVDEKPKRKKKNV